ncbi:MAG: hypothetical protein ABIL25_10795 [candidate division WOR-3 bacterium]
MTGAIDSRIGITGICADPSSELHSMLRCWSGNSPNVFGPTDRGVTWSLKVTFDAQCFNAEGYGNWVR